MVQRRLYVAAYDIRDPRRLRDGLSILKGYSTGGQKSVFECFLTPLERDQLLRQVTSALDLNDDSFLLVRLDPRSEVRTLGIAVPPEDPPYFYIG